MSSITDFVGLFILIAGFVIGLGAVTVIDLHGFLGRKSQYWTEATTRTHKITKPLIWLGIALTIFGEIITFRKIPFQGIPLILSITAVVLIINGLFLSFRVSPYLLQKEKAGKARELLPPIWQKRILVSLLFSDLGWWGSLLLVVYYLTNR